MMLAEPPPPTLRLRIDREALADNWRGLDRLSGSASAGAAVKADCYGLGVATCVPVLRDAGCNSFFVAHWSEVEAVARHVPAERIAVLHGPLSGQDAQYARQSGALPVINSIAQAKLWHESGGGPCHLMVDTGINRLGIAPADVSNPVIQSLEIDVLMSHLACADEDSPRNPAQLEAFRTVIPLVAHEQASLANSAGIALGDGYHFDLTRPGLALYGGIPRGGLAPHIREVATPEAAILQVREIEAGEGVGYNARFIAECDMRVGVVSLGYADGVLRAWGEKGYLLHVEQHLKILGTVSMDMIVVDLSDAPDIREGDWLQLPYVLPDAAQQTALSQYELLTVLGQRLRSSPA